MKQYTYLIAALLLTISGMSCRKDKQEDTCGGFFADIEKLTSQTEELVIYVVDPKTNGIKNRLNFSSGYRLGSGVYNVHQNSLYQMVGQQSGRRIELMAYHFATNEIQYYTYKGGLFDSIGHNINGYISYYGFVGSLFCNSTTDKIYSLNDINKDKGYLTLYELELSGSYFQEREIARINTQLSISVFSIDENSGFIYYVDYSNLSTSNLVKIDPNTGTSSIVGTYAGVKPSALMFNKNDGMFYGMDMYAMPYHFIKLEPQTGKVTKISTLDDGGYVNFIDNCRNMCIVETRDETRWVDPSNGDIVKKYPKKYKEPGVYYIESECSTCE